MNQSDDFLLAKIIELEKKIFELEKRVNGLENNAHPVDVDSNEEKSNNRTEKFRFDGEIYKKSKLVLAVISKYAQLHPGITAEELIKAFPAREVKCPFACVKDISTITENLIVPVKRYYIDMPIILADGTRMAVCTQWGPNIKDFIDYVKKYDFVIEQTTI